MRYYQSNFPLIFLCLVTSAILNCCFGRWVEREANACEDTKPIDDCKFMLAYNYCELDVDILKRKCDYTCGWCSESEECVDRAIYIKCHKLTEEQCNRNQEFFLSRCRKSCNWCNKEPRGAWTSWSAWSECSSSCNAGYRIRSRRCLTTDCKGSSREVSVCILSLCATWSPWSAWSGCSVNCGKGTKTRTRSCSQEDRCEGAANDAEACVLPSCTVGDVVYDKWTPCSKSCGGGTRKNISFCFSADKSLCPTTYEDCNTHRCPYKKCEEYRYGSEISACCSDREGQCPLAVKRIIGGQKSNLKRFVWMARIELQQPELKMHLCGGSLIHEQFVLTAAHCLEHIDPSMLHVVLGSISTSDTSTNVQRILVSNFTMHPNYSEPKNDLAIIRLKSKAAMTDFVKTICLPEGEDTPLDKQCFVAGWGLTSFQRLHGSSNLMEAKVRRLPYDICYKAHRYTRYGRGMDPDSMMCAGTVAGGVDTCRGDSGGPIMCQRCSSCSWYLAGVTSFGAEQCGAVGIPGVYMRSLYYEDWIIKFVEQFDELGLFCGDV